MSLLKKLHLLLWLFMAANACHWLQAQAPQYRVIVLPTPEEASSLTYGLNNEGQVIGAWFDRHSIGFPFVYSYATGELTPLVDPSAPYDFIKPLEGTDINDQGEIIGTAIVPKPSGAYVHAPYMLNSKTGEIVPLRDLDDSLYSYAYGINNAGQAVGNIQQESDGPRSLARYPAVFLNGSVIKLHNDGPGRAYKINDVYDADGIGQFIGEFEKAGSYTGKPFVYTNGTVIMLGSKLQAVCGEPLAKPMAINNAGQIVGHCKDFPNNIGFLYNFNESDTAAIGIEVGPAIDINDQGWAVGAHGLRGYLFHNGVTYYLEDLVNEDSGVAWLYPTGINNQLQISATSDLGAVLLVPVE